MIKNCTKNKLIAVKVSIMLVENKKAPYINNNEKFKNVDETKGPIPCAVFSASFTNLEIISPDFDRFINGILKLSM
tara:strand:+ start:534 stop:761 length:228 start_codon:yes stop_codon:yes gene_type:complete